MWSGYPFEVAAIDGLHASANTQSPQRLLARSAAAACVQVQRRMLLNAACGSRSLCMRGKAASFIATSDASA